LSEEHEKVQMNRLLGYLEQESVYRNEDCVIIIEPTIPYAIQDRSLIRKPDAIILKDNLFVLVELKAFEGDIIADCSRGATWKLKDGQELQPPGRINPFNQADGHRKALLDFLKTHFINNGNAPGWAKKDDYAMHDWIAHHIQSWVVTGEASRPIVTGIDPRNFPSFKVLPLEKVPNALAFLRSPEPLLAPPEMNRFLDALKAKITTRTEWYRGPLIEGQDQFLGLIPKITDWINSEEYNDIDRSLKCIRELDLKPHLIHVIRIWHDKRYASLRQEALLILIEWQYERLGKILDEALRDEDVGIVKFALEYLSHYGHAETVVTLTEMLQKGPIESRVSVIKAIAASGKESVCSVTLDFAEKNLFDKPFKDFQYWFDRAGHTMHGHPDRSKYEEFVRLDQKRLFLIQLCETVISSLGDLNCKRSIPWLKQIIDEPMSMGFESTDYETLESIPSNYYGVFARACESLGRIGIGDETVTELFLERLSTSPEDYQDCIIRALGDLGDQAAVPALLEFVTDRGNHLYDNAVSALSKLRSANAFEKLEESYLSDPLDDSGRWTGEALQNIDRLRFEGVLLNGITSGADLEFKQAFLTALLPIATINSIDVIFPLLKDPILSYRARWILSNLASEPEVHRRAMSLVHSENPMEQASAISVLEDYYLKDPDKLSEFEGKTTTVEVRRVLTALYEETRSIDRILKYAKDPDDEVRSNVFGVFTLRDGKRKEHFFLSSGSGIAERCVLIVDKDGLAIRLTERILFLPKTTISRAIVTEPIEKGRYGLFLVLKGPEKEESYLAVPIPGFKYDTSELCSELLQEVAIMTGRNLGEHKLTEDETKRVATLWSAVPNEPKDADRVY
jgi:HEAT repeat protein